MIVFLFLYLSIYGATHYYVFRRVQKALGFEKKTAIWIALFMLLMMLAPIIVRLAERVGIEYGARFFATVSFSWMGLLFLYFIISLLTDSAQLLGACLTKIKKELKWWPAILPRKLFYLQLALVIAIYGVGFFEARSIQVEHIEISSHKIPGTRGRIRIAQISDVHLGLLVREERLAKILATVKNAKPDLLVSTGDLVDGQLNNLVELEKIFASYNPRLGKIAVTGNHEFYAGLEEALSFTRKAGFTLLRRQALSFGSLNIVGVDDQMAESIDNGVVKTEKDLLFEQPNDHFTLLLKHRPKVDPESLGLFDLQLSGHTHKGQIFPFNILTWLFYPYPAGRTKLSHGELYVSRGSGTWGPPIRFLAPPEVTIIDLLPGKKPDPFL